MTNEKTGRLEDWKIGRLEDWKVGGLRWLKSLGHPSSLPFFQGLKK
jgi:hypothetical protein